jgi:hypothetical protein
MNRYIALDNSCDNQNFNNTTSLADNYIRLGNTLQTVYVENAIQVVSDERKNMM